MDKCEIVDNIFHVQIAGCLNTYDVKYIESVDKTFVHNLMLCSSWYISKNSEPFVHTHNIYYDKSADEDIMEILRGQPEEFETVREIIDDHVDGLDSSAENKRLFDLIHFNLTLDVDTFSV